MNLDVPACMSWPLPPGESVSEDRAQTMFTWQAGRCGICDGPKATVLDHDHATHLIRGYICRTCNIQEGVRFDVPRLTRWRSGWNPATLLGVVEEYAGRNDPWDLNSAFPEPTNADLRAAISRL